MSRRIATLIVANPFHLATILCARDSRNDETVSIQNQFLMSEFKPAIDS
ncbi:hypothetical protein Pr1d_19300 [Bythopirellula goksoeyrii]|uniref:Uncharacterized protein n=1 Tax=Bythopirellula goksoeyrii TaxID=1400387 RepID=A0A5B9Q6K8_9BACT|nr:hypothetical protein Pr1d_19300 [Bythopirellula goksoeyrii]